MPKHKQQSSRQPAGHRENDDTNMLDNDHAGDWLMPISSCDRFERSLIFRRKSIRLNKEMTSARKSIRALIHALICDKLSSRAKCGLQNYTALIGLMVSIKPTVESSRIPLAFLFLKVHIIICVLGTE